MTWETVPLSAVAKVEMGQAPVGDSYNDRSEGVGLIAGPGDFRAGKLAVKKFTSRPTKLSRAGDLVIGIRASIGDLVVSDGTYCLGRGVAAIRPEPESVDHHYLRHTLAWLKDELASRGRGATFLTVSRADIASLPIPLPPLPEQRRIAAILGEAHALRGAAHTMLLRTQDAHSSTARREVELSVQRGGRGRERLGDVIKLSSGRFLPKRVQREGDVQVFGGNGPTGQHNEYMFDTPQIAIGRVGALCGAVHVTSGRVWITDNALIANWDRERISIDHLAWQLRLANLNRYAAVSGQPSISAARIADVPLVTPTADEMSRLRHLGEAFERGIGLLARRLADLDVLFTSLQHRAFRGEL